MIDKPSLHAGGTIVDSAKVSLQGSAPRSLVISLAAPRPDSAVVSLRLPLKELSVAVSAVVGLGYSAVVALNGQGPKIGSAIASLSSFSAKVSAFVTISPQGKEVRGE